MAAGSAQALREFVLPQLEDPQGFLAKVEYLYRHPEEVSRDEILCNDGRVFDRYSASVRSPDGDYYGRVWYFRDITDRKHAEAALRESQQRLATLVATAPDAITILDADTGRWIDVNENTVRLYGYSREALLQMHPANVSPPLQPDGRSSHEAAKEKIQEALDGGMPVFEWWHVNAAGDLLPCEVRLVRLPDAQRRLVRGSIVDITERKRAEVALREAKDAAEAASRAKSEFLANMSHELRTPLNSVLGYAQILKSQEDLSPRQLRALNIIEQSGEHLLGLIDDVLDLAKIEAKTLELQPTSFDLPRLLESIAGIVGGKAAAKGLKFRSQVSPALPQAVQGEARRLRQVLLNLLDNAIKYTSAGSVTLNVRPEGGAVRFAVQDTGVGIAPEHLSSIFDIFHQVPDRSGFQEGAGLGLAISQRLVALMGGELAVASTPGGGISRVCASTRSGSIGVSRAMRGWAQGYGPWLSTSRSRPSVNCWKPGHDTGASPRIDPGGR
jgi:PAS domain S-box-containing protein